MTTGPVFETISIGQAGAALAPSRGETHAAPGTIRAVRDQRPIEGEATVRAPSHA